MSDVRPDVGRGTHTMSGGCSVVVALLVVGTLSRAVSWAEARRIKRGSGIALAFSARVFEIAAFSFVLLIACGVPGRSVTAPS
jgi:uncharacterized YccA/Bax inhibitor family protein